MTVRFDAAWQSAIDVARRTTSTVAPYDRILVRDLVGKISIIVDDRQRSVPAGAEAQVTRELTGAAGPFRASTPVLLASELFDPDAVFEASDLFVLEAGDDDRGRLSIADRGAVGAEWGTTTTVRENRVALYSFKGGVGRSTAAFMLARHFARSGLCVLATDVDLESPGVGALLQEEEHLPDHGLVDHFVEDAVGNATDLDLVSRSQVVQPSGNGEVWVAPAGGRPREGYDYLSKLNRVYVDLPAHGRSTRVGFTERLARAIDACEEAVTRHSRPPDVVLLDSRAGMHDIAAVTLTQLSSVSLLFAMNNPQTWAGYAALFRQWGRTPELAQTMRERLRMVAAFVPQGDDGSYLARFRDRAQACFADALYENASGDDPDAYNPSPADETAPHYPLPVLFTSELVSLDQLSRRGWHASPLVQAAYAQFLHGAEQLILGGER
jgi:MinD-like ATPase involved in chromosome partitioning or flagellar assembly